MQTNEVQRSWALLPGFLALADGRPLDLLELGPSAGLNLVWDRYALPLPHRVVGRGSELVLTGDDRVPPPAELLAGDVSGGAAARHRPEPGRRDDRARRARAAVVRLGRPDASGSSGCAARSRSSRADPPELIAGDYVELLPGCSRTASTARS